ncbi:M949_RS01915 family surface polysaccharide biosynthesis protein [Flectobacillus major]|jgi:hypothetical protein|uniref:M949_RS01915 family surface polysaccharide biosynthesis protein n=1 Tax=Flectobacillus major TaxID=103 RepID=UPI00040AFB22|nr:hypothetical protein [Flectobacillus major]
MKKIFFLLLLPIGCFSQIKPIAFDKKVPAAVKVQGKVVDAIRWQDSQGDNLVFLSVERKTVKSKDAPSGEAENALLHAYQYLKQDNSYLLTWELKDAILACPLDVTADFVPKSLAVTDLNTNGIGEVLFLYKTACRADVSSAALKLLLYEQKKKYMLRGDTYLKSMNEGGKYTIDKSFQTAPKVFLEYAKKQWNKFKAEEF